MPLPITGYRLSLMPLMHLSGQHGATLCTDGNYSIWSRSRANFAMLECVFQFVLAELRSESVMWAWKWTQLCFPFKTAFSSGIKGLGFVVVFQKQCHGVVLLRKDLVFRQCKIKSAGNMNAKSLKQRLSSAATAWPQSYTSSDSPVA